MPTVWLPNTSANHDYSAATKFGTLRQIFDGPVKITDTTSMIETVKVLLDRSATEDDYLITSGNTFLNVVVGHYFLTRFKRINVLVHTPKERTYSPLTLNEFMPRKGGLRALFS